MKWNEHDIEIYLKAKEYVDTAIIPLIKIDLEESPLRSIKRCQILLNVMDEVERHVKGRVLEMPPFTYVVKEEKIKRLIAWEEQVINSGFDYVFYVTFDPYWEKFEDELQHPLICLRGLDINNFHHINFTKMIQNFADEILTFIKNKWKMTVVEK